MDWQSLVKTVAPWIGTALGGPLGGMAVEAIAGALGLSDKTQDAVKQALSGATPEQMLALKTADQAFSVAMQKLGFEHLQALELAAAGDRASAREREIKTGDSTTPKVLAILITLGFFGVLLCLVFSWVPTDGKPVVMMMLGALATGFGTVMNYYFGSSAGSAAKNDILAMQASQATYVAHAAQNRGAA